MSRSKPQLVIIKNASGQTLAEATRGRDGSLKLCGLKLRGARLSHCDLRGTDFTEAILDEADLSFSDCRGCRFSDAQMLNAMLVFGDFEGTHFERAILTGAHGEDANFCGADFSGATAEGFWGSSADFTRTKFVGTNLYWAQLFKARMRGADLSKALLCGPVLQANDFTDATFCGSNCGPDNLGGATEFEDAVLAGAHFGGATLTHTRFKNCTYSAETRFPPDSAVPRDGLILRAR